MSTSNHTSDPREAALLVLAAAEHSSAPLGALLDDVLDKTSFSIADKRLLRELVSGTIRWQLRLDWFLSHHYHADYYLLEPLLKSALRIGLYQILYLDRIPDYAALNQSVQLVKKYQGKRSAGLVNGVLRSALRAMPLVIKSEEFQDPMLELAIRFSHPRWMVRRWVKRYGIDAAVLLMDKNNEPPHLSLRVSSLKTPMQELCYEFEKQGFACLPGRYDPDVIHTTERYSAVAQTEVFRSGECIVQDEAAALAARLTGVREGMRAIDLCAAPGGKAVDMAWMMRGSGTVVAVDLHEHKLLRLGTTIDRTGLQHVITPLQGDARTVELDPADVVLVDAPCSGLGVIRKKPDIKWRRSPEAFSGLQALQQDILEHAARMVCNGGHLVYTTCSIEPAENEEIIEGFLRQHPEFVLVDAREVLPPEVVSEQGYLQTLPHVHGIDGAFGARLRNVSG